LQDVANGEQVSLPAEGILVVDTDAGVRWSLEKGLTHSGYAVHVASTVEQAVHIVQMENIIGILLELMPEAGLTPAVLSSLLKAPNSPTVVCTSLDAAPPTVIECMRRGANDFLVKPFSLGEVRAALGRALATRAKANPDGEDEVEHQEFETSFIVGVSPPVQEMRAVIRQVAQTDLNCLIRGESGVGKDVLAREVHRLSRRGDCPFVKVNCSALPEQLLESELFGFERGAFTGAVASKPGRFSMADRGIIFLDEICEVHPNLQAKLLQVIEHKEFTKLGGRHSQKVDVQIVAATNADIEGKIRSGEFRQDLYFRLNEVCIWVPPLSERREDVPLLVRYFTQKYSHYTGSRKLQLTGEQLDALCKRPWPGNVRELESTIKRWLVLGKLDLEPDSTPPGKRKKREKEEEPPEVEKSEQEEMEERLTPEAIRGALEENQWNRRRTAEALGISYQMLRRRINKHKIAQTR